MHLLIISDGDSKYGSANSLYGLVSSLKKIDSSIKISIALTMNSEKLESYLEMGCNAFKIPYTFYYRGVSYEKWKRPLSYIKHLPPYLFGRMFALRRLEQHVDLRSVDVVHTNTTREDLSWEIKEKYRKPLVMHIREFGDLDYQCFSYRRNYLQIMNRTVDRFIAISDTVRKHWINKGVDEKKIIRVYNGVNAPSNSKTIYESSGDIKIVLMGALLETKGQHIALEAISSIKEEKRKHIKLDLLGDCSNSYGDVLVKYVHEHHLEENICFKGYVNNPGELLYEYDCGLMCSKSEGFGRVTAEYMMAGLCVIASGAGANRELIEDNVCGMIYNANDSKDLACKIEKIIDDRGLISTYGRAAKEKASHMFTTDRNAMDIYNIYMKLIDSQK